MEPKKYVPRSGAKQISPTLLKLSFHASELIEFVKANTNERGYINLGVSQRKEVGRFGDTHCVWLDTWKPTRQQQPNQHDAFAESMATAPKPPSRMDTPGSDDVPF